MTSKSLEKMVDEQVKKWEITHGEKKKRPEEISIITISREPGSGGRIVAKEIAKQLDLHLFHQEILHQMAKSAQVSPRLLKTLDEKAFSVLGDWILTMVDRNHLWPDQYLKHLLNVIGTIGKHGRAVLVGRGANFILPPEGRIRVRIVAPLKIRIQHVASDFGLTSVEAKRRVLRTDSDRRAFVRKYFHADISDPVNYDLVLNTGTLSISAAVESIKSAIAR